MKIIDLTLEYKDVFCQCLEDWIDEDNVYKILRSAQGGAKEVLMSS